MDNTLCGCKLETFEWDKKEYEIDEGPYRILHRFEIKECSIHKNTRGRRRKEEKYISCISPIENYELNENDLKFFKSIFSKLWKDKVNERTWYSKLNQYFDHNKVEDISNGYIQKGIIFKKILFAQSSTQESVYYLLTNRGKERLKILLRFLNIKEQLSLGKDKIINTIESYDKKPLNPSKKILYHLLNNQLELIMKNDAGWQLKNSIIVPQNSAVNPPKYIIILFGLCTWLEIYRDGMTLREVSVRAFQSSQVLLSGDPSKALDKYQSDLNNILEQFASVTCEQLGLVLTLEYFVFSGEIHVTFQDNKRQVLKGPSNSVSNLIFTNIKKIKVTTKKVLLIENSQAYAQLVLDNYWQKSDILIIFIKGMSIASQFRKRILQQIVKDNPDLRFWFFLDFDLGGCRIYKTASKILEGCKSYIVNIPAEFNLPYRDLPESHKKSIESFLLEDDTELISFAKFILEKGKIEQEYLLEWYIEILRFNFKRINIRNGVKHSNNKKI